MLNKENREKCGKVIKIHPQHDQLQVAQEEAAEFIQAISKYLRFGDLEPLMEEYADLCVVMEEVRQMFRITDEEVNKRADVKLYRTLEGKVVVKGDK